MRDLSQEEVALLVAGPGLRGKVLSARYQGTGTYRHAQQMISDAQAGLRPGKVHGRDHKSEGLLCTIVGPITAALVILENVFFGRRHGSGKLVR